MTEKDGIPFPWHPESHKPTVPFVICTNGDGHYWIGRYIDDGKYSDWQFCDPQGSHSSLIAYMAPPIAWIEPEKFVPFVKKIPDTYILHLTCYECGLTCVVFIKNAKEWECPTCSVKKREPIKRWRKLDNLDVAVGDPDGEYILVKAGEK